MVEIPEHQRHRMEQAFIRSYRQEALGGELMKNILQRSLYEKVSIDQDVSDHAEFFMKWLRPYIMSLSRKIESFMLFSPLTIGTTEGMDISPQDINLSGVTHQGGAELYRELITQYQEAGLAAFLALTRAHINIFDYEEAAGRGDIWMISTQEKALQDLRSADRKSFQELPGPVTNYIDYSRRTINQEFWGVP